MIERICPADELITVDLEGFLDAAEDECSTESFDLDGKKVD